VIPPRPKPGRKPATDTPPTKRKAQNRAAQRAFRERRAARVGELEEQLKETEEERQKRENEMHEQIIQQHAEISRLEGDVQRLHDEAVTWRSRYFELQRRFDDERSDKDAALLELAYLRNGSRAIGTNAVPLPPRRPQTLQKPQPTTIPQDTIEAAQVSDPLGCGGCTATSTCACVETAMSISAAGCGNCTVDSHCQCLEETLKVTNLEIPTSTDLKRPLSIVPDTNSTKRSRLSVEVPDAQEIDFTAQFSQPRATYLSKSSDDQMDSSMSQVPTESCGFCADGTYCACAEAAGTLSRAAEQGNENRLAPLLNEVTPPPSDSGVTSPDAIGFKLPPLHPNHRIHHPLESEPAYAPLIPRLRELPAKASASAQASCSGVPGSCKQCQEDPRSGLFCRSLAAARASNGPANAVAGNCCGGGNATGGGCCKQQGDNAVIRLSCAETYQTLKTHKNFEQASDNIGDWLPKLHTSLPSIPGRAPLDIEAASVMNVIKYFDVRFGRD
jgi:hypothetical protein